jgi:hypothetical protein
MEFSKLNLGQASLVKKEVDMVVQKLNELAANNPSNLHSDDNNNLTNGSIPVINYQNYKQKLLSSIQHRIDELEQFYLSNSDDERAVLFEKERLRMRKILQSYLSQQSSSSNSSGGILGSTPRGGGVGGFDNRSMASGGTGSKNQHSANYGQNLSTTANSHNVAHNTSTHDGAMHVDTSLTVNRRGEDMMRSNLSPNSQLLSTTRRSPGQQPIYDWEDRSEKPSRSVLQIDDNAFEPTSRPGFYKRVSSSTKKGSEMDSSNPDEDERQISDKYLDFQIVLTQDEITALASRRKKERDDKKLMKSQAAATSVHSSVPYVDPRRIKLEMLRPGHPDRWLHPEGMR